MTTTPTANATSTSSKTQRPELATNTRAQDPIQQPRTKIESNTHLGITIRWGVEAAMAAAAAVAGDGRC